MSVIPLPEIPFTIANTPSENGTLASGFVSSSAKKNIHIGEGISYVSYVVNKKGQSCHVSILRSAKNNVFDAELAERMDSTACEIIRNMPPFIPARNKEGEFVNYRMYATIRFR